MENTSAEHKQQDDSHPRSRSYKKKRHVELSEVPKSFSGPDAVKKASAHSQIPRADRSGPYCLEEGVIERFERSGALIAEPFPGPGSRGSCLHRCVGPRTVIPANETHNRLRR